MRGGKWKGDGGRGKGEGGRCVLLNINMPNNLKLTASFCENGSLILYGDFRKTGSLAGGQGAGSGDLPQFPRVPGFFLSGSDPKGGRLGAC